MAELADAPDLGSGAQKAWGFKSPLSHQDFLFYKPIRFLKLQDMSWDIFVQELPPGIKDIAEIPSDFRPKNVRRSEIIHLIQCAIPEVDFSDPTWGNLDGLGYSIEISIGNEEEASGLALHVRGSPAAAPMVCKILRAVESLGITALDGSQPGGLFDFDKAEESIRKWIAYRDQIAGQ